MPAPPSPPFHLNTAPSRAGEAKVWLCGLALALALSMVCYLLGLIVFHGLADPLAASPTTTESDVRGTNVAINLWHFLTQGSADPGGGLWPAIFGTFVMTLTMSIFVTPLGVMAAIYIREYAHQGFAVRAFRVLVHNLAGVPSIVFGVFGLVFFVRNLGGFIDAGPAQPTDLSTFFILAILWILTTITIIAVAVHTAPAADTARPSETLRLLSATLWCVFAILAVTLIWKNPFFTGIHREPLPAPTFAKGGILWASLTLALLTLPIVVVATDQALAAVPRSVREAALACGASKWQVILRIVFPVAAPGILTGVILAMARAAGEVAPIMLVGAAPMVHSLALDATPSLPHTDYGFMHLGHQIYHLGFSSTDAVANRPMVFAATLVLVITVLVMNLTAIVLRNKMRKKIKPDSF